MNRKTIQADYLQTMGWLDGKIVDWASAGKLYSLTGEVGQLARYHYSPFDGVVTSIDEQYVFIYKRFGTKGLLLKNGELLREINRSYYFAEAYEYPAVFITVGDVTYLVHCPVDYHRIDFENAETGELITDVPGRAPSDVFHSRLEISPGGTYLMSRGWLWHPLNVVQIFSIHDCIKNPLLLDNSTLEPDWEVEICTASFIDETRVLIGSTNEAYDEERAGNFTKCVGIWNLKSDIATNPAKPTAEFGNLFAINERYAWDMFKYPKIIDINTGEVVDKDESIASGSQKSSIKDGDIPKMAYSRETKQIAIAYNNIIEILSTDNC